MVSLWLVTLGRYGFCRLRRAVEEVPYFACSKFGAFARRNGNLYLSFDMQSRPMYNWSVSKSVPMGNSSR